MCEIINAFYIDNDLNHMIMMVCISYDFFVINDILGTFLLRFGSIFRTIGKTEHFCFVLIVSLLCPNCMIFIFI
jgi:hypothetical protein